MNAERFTRELDAILLRAAGSLALAREIETALTRVGVDGMPEQPWRSQQNPKRKRGTQ